MSEIKDADMGHHESWCDCKNSISNYCNCLASGYIEQIHDLKAKYEKAVSALKHYSNEVDNDTYLDIFDCIKRESDAVTSFDEVKFAKVSRETLAELGEK